MAWAVRLSSVTLLHPRHRLELFGNIFAPPSSSGTRTVCIKISCKNSNGFWGSCRINTGGMKNWRFSTNISLYFENGTRYGPSYNERWIGIRMQSIEWCHFQWPLIVKKNSKMVQDRTIVTTADQCKVVLWSIDSIGTILIDLERPLTQFSRSCQYSTLNISVTVEYRDIFTMKDE